MKNSRILSLLLLTFCILLYSCNSEHNKNDVSSGTGGVSNPDSQSQTAGNTPEAEEKDSALEFLEEPAEKLEQIVTDESLTMNFTMRLGIALGIVLLQGLLIWLSWQGFKILNKKITAHLSQKLKPLSIKNLKILNVKQIINIILFLAKIAKYIVTVFQLFITLPIIFSLFPATENIASTLFNYILHPLKTIGRNVIGYIPKLITIVIILTITRYALRALKFFTIQIAKEKLVIPGFYADWAYPTFNILRVLLYAFTIAIIYPYLPGSESQIFQGISVFIGIIFSLGSSSVIGNLMAGLVITYMRPFKIGDRIRLQDNTGFVVEKSPFVIRIKTIKNEYITYPNLTILTSNIINYNTSSDEDAEGLILNAEITFTYHTPWTQIHEILIAAALKTKNTLSKPKPFVLQTALDDFYCRYQINVYTKEVRKIASVYSELFQNIQDGFKEAGLDMTAPHYKIILPPDVEPPQTSS
ncbi:MAG: mechanosensitive ion channel family protein [Treponema sp.]|jgi:small-conductance mechanosensitive channel|nr:mechanosensitive ion channel family protein [Treponema sp.]